MVCSGRCEAFKIKPASAHHAHSVRHCGGELGNGVDHRLFAAGWRSLYVFLCRFLCTAWPDLHPPSGTQDCLESAPSIVGFVLFCRCTAGCTDDYVRVFWVLSCAGADSKLLVAC